MAVINIIVKGRDDGASGVLGGTLSGVQRLGKVAAGIALGGVTALGAGLVAVGLKAKDAGSDLNESINAVNVVFGESADVILQWGKTAADTAGLSQAQFAQMAAQTGAMLQNFGLSTEQAADQTTLLAQRAADMASIFNTDVNDALIAIQAGLRGEADPLERFGVSLSAAAVKAKALELGLEDANGELDNAAMTQARLALLYEQTDKIAGDFVNTSGDLANATRVQQARWENFLAQIGRSGLPIIQKFKGLFMDLAERILPRVAEVVEFVAEAVGTFVDGLLSGEDPIGDIANLVFDLALAFGASQEQAEALFFKVREGINAFLEFIQPLVEFIQQNVMLKDVMIALGIAVASVVIPAIISLLATIFPIVLAIGGLIAAVVLVRKAWENNWGDIQGKTKAVWAFLQPVLENLQAWLAENIPIAVDKLVAFWNDKLKPALEAVWKFLSVDMLPVWEALGEIIGIVVVASIANLISFWENQLKPALEAIWKFIKDNIIPIFEDWSDRVGGLQGIIQKVVEWLNRVRDAILSLPGLPTGLFGGGDSIQAGGSSGLLAGTAGAGVSSGANFQLTINTMAPVDIPHTAEMMRVIARI